ncbi:MAG: response regulator [Pseudohongiella sp.]|nr:response regulator [Pseudohongiella sp.]MDP2126452.1 response regulator [Pseudohongiella sp.]
MTQPIVYVVDDDDDLRNAIIRALDLNGYSAEGFSSAESFLEAGISGHGCILLDVRMAGMSGFQLQELLMAREFTPPIVFLTGHADIPSTVTAMKLGASNILTKPVSTELLLQAVEAAILESSNHLQGRLKVKDVQNRYETLTQREREVYELVIRGRLNKQIAYELGTTERTIKAHRHQVMSKMGAVTVQNLMHTANILGKLESAEEGL